MRTNQDILTMKQIILRYLEQNPQYKKDYNLFEISPTHPFEHAIFTLINALSLLIRLDTINKNLSKGHLQKNTSEIGSYFEAIDILFTAKSEVIN